MNAPDPYVIWFLVGLVLVLAEFAVPGVILVFVGLGAWVASVTTWLGWTGTLGSQMAVFAVGSLVLLMTLRRVFKPWFTGISSSSAHPGDLDEFVGRRVTVVSAVKPGTRGKVEFKGANWTAESDTAFEPGEPALISRVEGLCLHIRQPDNPTLNS